METKEELEAELKALEAQEKERVDREKLKAKVDALKAKNPPTGSLKATRKDIGGSGIVDMLSRNHYRNGIFLLGLFCGLLTQLFF